MSNSSEDEAAIRTEQARIEVESAKFLGLVPEEASALAAQLNLRVRVVDLDCPTWYTPDLRRDRLTVEVKDGRVVTASAS